MRYSTETREKTQSSGFQIKFQDGVREGPHKRGEISSEFCLDFGDFEREEKFFWGRFVLVYRISMKFAPINVNG